MARLSAGRRDVSPRAALPLLVGCFVFGLTTFASALLNDGDTFWHVATGAWILAHHAVPHVDEFSFTAAGHPWVPEEWLSEVLLALAHRLAGWAGVMALSAFAAALTAALLARHLLYFLRVGPALLLLLLALSLVTPSLLARPHLLALPCLEVWCAGLIFARARGTAPSFWLLPVMTLWANLHGSFMFGLLLPGVFLLEALAEAPGRRLDVLIRWSVFIVAAWIAAFLTPNGLTGILFPFELLRLHGLNAIGEWRPVDFSRLQPLELVLFAALYLGLTGRVRLPPLRVLLLLALVYEALAHSRNGMLLGIVGALAVAEPLGRSIGRPATDDGRVDPSLALITGGVAAVLLVMRLLVPSPLVDRANAPVAALAAVPPRLRALPVLNDYSFGGYLILRDVRTFIDGRADLYGAAGLARYRAIMGGSPSVLDRTLQAYSIAWAILMPDDAPARELSHRPGWCRLYADPIAVVFARADAVTKTVSSSPERAAAPACVPPQSKDGGPG